MGEMRGFLKHRRQQVGYRPVKERIHDFKELELALTPEQIKNQAARCMDCGIPFCHAGGCPLGNRIPDFNELVYKDKWHVFLILTN
jgi:glutamate synthase (NADPH/NADH) small chain